MHNKKTFADPILIIVRGIPGGGKSYITKSLVDILGIHNTLVLDPDQIDQKSAEYIEFSKELDNEGVDKKFHLYRFSRQQAYDAAVQKKITVWNQAFMDFNGLSLTIKRIEDVALEHHLTLKTLIVEVEIDPEVAKTRIADRKARGGHDVPDDALAHFVDRYESFEGKGYPIVTINGIDDVEKSVSAIVSSLNDIEVANRDILR